MDKMSQIVSNFTKLNDLREIRTILTQMALRDAIANPQEYKNSDKEDQVMELISFLDMLYDESMKQTTNVPSGIFQNIMKEVEFQAFFEKFNEWAKSPKVD